MKKQIENKRINYGFSLFGLSYFLTLLEFLTRFALYKFGISDSTQIIPWNAYEPELLSVLYASIIGYLKKGWVYLILALILTASKSFSQLTGHSLYHFTLSLLSFLIFTILDLIMLKANSTIARDSVIVYILLGCVFYFSIIFINRRHL